MTLNTKVPLTDLRAVNNDYLFQKWFSNCRKTGVYASVQCELNNMCIYSYIHSVEFTLYTVYQGDIEYKKGAIGFPYTLLSRFWTDEELFYA